LRFNPQQQLLLPELKLHTPIVYGPGHPSQDVHPFGDGERALAADAVIPSIEAPGLRHRSREPRLQVVFRFFYRSDRRLAIILRSYRLACRQSCIGVGGGLTDRCIEFRDVGTAGTGLGKRWTEAKHRAKDQTGSNPAASDITMKFVH
jgi:hypothetical protein